MNDINIMVIDDEKSLLLDIREYFKSYPLITFDDPLNAISELKKKYYDILIVDFKMPGITGLELLIEAKRNNSYEYAVLLSAFIDKPLLENMINKNLINRIVEKPLKLKILKDIINEAINICIKKKAENNEVILSKFKYQELKSQLTNHYDIIGIDKGLKEVYENIKLVSERPANVMITGETGTGKELVAKLIHDLSNRKNNPFIKVNCAAIPGSLFESELFGYKKGAFTDAKTDKPGKFELANNGTLFLDEIGELKLDLQAKLLRVLQEKEVYRLGDISPIPVDFNLVTATNIDLKKAVTEKSFRQDLYYRINEFPIHLPSLRERKEDIPDLLKFFIKKYSIQYNLEVPLLNEPVIHQLTKYKWPGNIRELENVIKQIMIRIKNEDEITSKHIKFILDEIEQYNSVKEISQLIREGILGNKFSFKDIKKFVIKDILDYFDGNISKAVVNTNIKKDQFYKYR